MVSIVAATGDLFLATERTRATLGHLRKRLRFRPYVSPEPIVEDLEGQPVILHPAHVRTFLAVPREPLDQCLAELVWKIIHLLVNCPSLDTQTNRLPAGAIPVSRTKRLRLLVDAKRPFSFGPSDFLAIVRVKPADAPGETVGVLGGYLSYLAGQATSRVSSPALPVPNAASLRAPAVSASLEGHIEHAQVPWLRC
jgi:hypothetical protein